MVGSAVATMVWSSAARNMVSIRLSRMVRTSLWQSGARGAIGGASSRSITSVVIARKIARRGLRQRRLVTRVTARAVEVVHGGRLRIDILPLARKLG
jgi:hypothetical protein